MAVVINIYYYAEFILASLVVSYLIFEILKQIQNDNSMFILNYQPYLLVLPNHHNLLQSGNLD